MHKLSLDFFNSGPMTYSFQDFFYLNSSVKQLNVKLCYKDMIPSCSVSWRSLRNLSLGRCILSDESIANILPGCPILETLKLRNCHGLLQRLDLRKSLSLTRLEIVCYFFARGPTEIVALHIHYLRLRNSYKPYTLMDVSSLTEANLDIYITIVCPLEAVSVQTTLL